jgi:hypothetical protein
MLARRSIAIAARLAAAPRTSQVIFQRGFADDADAPKEQTDEEIHALVDAKLAGLMKTGMHHCELHSACVLAPRCAGLGAVAPAPVMVCLTQLTRF